MGESNIRDGRNYGIDLLKMTSMLMVVFLHLLGGGGILDGLEQLSLGYEMMWLLETACYCAVNCFAMATGYIMCRTRFKYSRIIALWLQVVFYTLGITLLFSLFMPGYVGLRQWKWALTPVASMQYWYFTAYFGMFFFIPFFNKLIAALDRRELKRLVAAVILLFTMLPLISRQDVFRLHAGYSMAWLSALYFIGAYFRLYPPKRDVRSLQSFLGYCAMILATWLSKLAVQAASSMWGSGELRTGGALISYVSPTILAASVFLFLAFANKSFGPWAQKVISHLSPASFGVYLIHCHPLVWNYVLWGSLAGLTSLPAFVLGAAVILLGLCVYAACTVIDLMRGYLFARLGVAGLSVKAEGLFAAGWTKLSDFFENII